MGLFDIRKFDVTLQVEIDKDEDDSRENILGYLERLEISDIQDMLVDIIEVTKVRD